MRPLTALVAAAALVALPVRADKPAPPAADFVDDAALLDTFTKKVGEFARTKKGLPSERMKALAAEDGKGTLALRPAAADRLDPEEVYRRALPSVFLVGSVVPDKDAEGGYIDGRIATAWVAGADGVLVTNWHVFDEVEPGECFGVLARDGTAYPVTDLIAVDRRADVAVFKVPAKGLAALSVADKPAAVGAWVGLLGHPGDRYFTFTQGAVSRYSKVRAEDGGVERWVAVTADYAYGSSGSPVLDRTGAVVGMAALTENIDYPEAAPADEPKDPAPKKDALRRRVRRADGDKPKDGEKPPNPAAHGSLLQMVVKLAVPASEIRRVAGGE